MKPGCVDALARLRGRAGGGGQLAPQPFPYNFGPLLGDALCTYLRAMLALTFELTSVYMLYYPRGACA